MIAQQWQGFWADQVGASHDGASTQYKENSCDQLPCISDETHRTQSLQSVFDPQVIWNEPLVKNLCTAQELVSASLTAFVHQRQPSHRLLKFIAISWNRTSLPQFMSTTVTTPYIRDQQEKQNTPSVPSLIKRTNWLFKVQLTVNLSLYIYHFKYINYMICIILRAYNTFWSNKRILV